MRFTYFFLFIYFYIPQNPFCSQLLLNAATSAGKLSGLTLKSNTKVLDCVFYTFHLMLLPRLTVS